MSSCVFVCFSLFVCLFVYLFVFVCVIFIVFVPRPMSASDVVSINFSVIVIRF